MHRIVQSLMATQLRRVLRPNLAQVPCLKCNLQKFSRRFSSKSVYLIDEDSSGSDSGENYLSKFTNRTYHCGELSLKHVGQSVVLCGWLEFHRMNKFIVLRDSYGHTQLLIGEHDEGTQKLLQGLPFESVIEAHGIVIPRPEDLRNKRMITGDVEVLVNNLKVLNKAKTALPFNIREFQRAREALRMQYRYLDLRFPQMQRNLRVRSEMLMRMREFLVDDSGFVDVETPTLFKATPGGAQEFIVPTRFPGQFYSLVQSPQQFKQMLMAGAIDRYFQIARCYRDEGARPDRQPEFTQLDIEMSFTDLEKILTLVEELLCYSWPKFLQALPTRFQRMSFKDAMEQYGTDQPDTRYEFKLQNCSGLLRANSGLVRAEDFGAYCVVFPPEFSSLTKQVKENFAELAKQFSDVKLVQSKVGTVGEFVKKTGKMLTETIAQSLAENCGVVDGGVVFLAFGDREKVLKLLGKIRVDYADMLESLDIGIKKKSMELLWVTDFPLFEAKPDGSLQSAHHPFTAPHPDDLHLLDTAPAQVRGLSYDLVLNGNEIGGGSVRIHEPELQEQVLRMLNIDVSTMQHILDMLGSGCPPHGGIALGLDRLLAKILHTTSIRDVIAFPKGSDGRDPLSGAPSAVSEAVQRLYHIKSITKDEKQ